MIPSSLVKHDIVEFRWSAMVKQTNVFGLPYLQDNPFSIRPLEEGEAHKLVGRQRVFNTLQGFLRLRSPRRVMLLGPLGSGRTSLVRCLKPSAGAFALIDHLPATNPAKALLEACYTQLVGDNPPTNRSSLANALVNEMYAFGGHMPMIVIDVPASDVSVLEVALRDAHTALERLNAMLVLVCDQHQRRHLPQTVLEGFEQHHLGALNESDVMDLVSQRLTSVGCEENNFTRSDAEDLLNQCDGYPASVVTLLRDAIDSIRMREAETVGAEPFPTAAQPHPRDEENRLSDLMGPSRSKVLPSSDQSPEQVGAQASGSAPSSSSHSEEHPVRPSDVRMNQHADEQGTLIDASVPWDQRDGLLPDHAAEESGFDLNIEQLNADQGNDEPLQETPFRSTYMDASENVPSRVRRNSGPFHRLVNRNIDELERRDAAASSGEAEDDAMNTRLLESSSVHEYWGPEPLDEENVAEDVTEDESAALIHDEIGLPEVPIETAMEAPLESAGTEEPLDLPAQFEATFTAPPQAPNGGGDGIEHLLSALMAMLSGSTQDPPNEATRAAGVLMDFFAGRQRPNVGLQEDFPLNPTALSSLNMTEAYVLSIANERAYSPSDETMLKHMGIKRSRLSQISNKLLQQGILSARSVGRSRQYMLTQAARAQLIAWGGLQGGAQ